MTSLEDRVVAVTGAAGSIGSATAIYFPSKDTNRSLADIDEKTLDGVAQKIRTRYKSQENFLELAATLGRESGVTAAHQVTDQAFDSVMATNVKGVMACQRAQLRHIEDEGSGVNSASVFGKIGIPNMLAYYIALSRSLPRGHFVISRKFPQSFASGNLFAKPPSMVLLSRHSQHDPLHFPSPS